MPRPTDTITFEVDFNDIDKNGRLLASMRFASGAVRFPEPGERVVAHDAEGNWCEGIVHSHHGLIVEITLDRDSWTQRPRTTVTNHFENAVLSARIQNTRGSDPKRVPELVG